VQPAVTQAAVRAYGWLAFWCLQVLDNSLEAHVMRSDNSSLAKDCRKDIKAANARLMKLGRKVNQLCLLSS